MGIIINNPYFVFQSVSSIQPDGIDVNFTRTAIIEKDVDLPLMPKAIDGGEVHSPSSEISLTFCKYVLVIFLTI